MLPLESLNKSDFFEIMEQARHKIHNYHPQWTDENYHDPGITILELLSWLSDMQRYYLDRVTDKSYRRFFNLLGYEEGEPDLARAFVDVNTKESMYIPKGYQFLAGNVVFETECGSMAWNNEIINIVREENNHAMSLGHILGNSVSCYPFGEELKEGTALYLGFSNPIDINEIMDVYFSINVANAEFENGLEAAKHVLGWSYLNKDFIWQPIEIINDKTQGMICSGHVSFLVKEEMGLKGLFHLSQSLYWIKIELQGKGVNPAPELESILLNRLAVTNCDVLSDFQEFTLLDSEAIDIPITGLYLLSQVTIQRQVKENSWIDLEDDFYNMEKLDNMKDIRIEFKEKESGVFRLLMCKDSFMNVIGSGNGLPHQIIEYNLDKTIISKTIIQVGEESTDNIILWKDFIPTNDFVASSASNYNYICNLTDGTLKFGTDEKGNSPYKGFANIRFIRYYESHFQDGNVRKGEINQSEIHNPSFYKVTNEEAAKGGCRTSSIETMKEWLNQEQTKISRAVSLKDYEKLTKQIPGVKLHKIKAIANLKDQNQISIVLIPNNGEEAPEVSAAYLEMIRDTLEVYRLLGTSLEVIGPEYIWIDVSMKLHVRDRRSFNVQKLSEALKQRYSIHNSLNHIGEDADETNFYQFLYGYEGIVQIEDFHIQRSRNIGLTSVLLMGDLQIELV